MMMQVMTLAFPRLFMSDSMQPDTLETLDAAIYIMNWAALALTMPIMIYSVPIWQGAYKA